MRYLSYVVEPEKDGFLLESVLEHRLHISQAMMRRAKFHDEAILVDGEPARLLSHVHTGQTVMVDVSDSWRECEESDVCPQPGDLSILYEDDDLLILNKPAGIVVHPSPGHKQDTLGNYVLYYLQQKGTDCKLLYPVHRLDIGTTGILVFAKHAYARSRMQDFMGTDVDPQALDILAQQPWSLDKSGLLGCDEVKEGVFKRTYLALCCGVFHEPRGTVDAPIRRITEFGLRREVHPDGKRAITHYEVLRTIDNTMSLLALQLVTGRTHQIRVHMEHLGHPLVGDELYESPLPLLNHPALHSWKLLATHPVTGALLELSAPLPEDVRALIDNRVSD